MTVCQISFRLCSAMVGFRSHFTSKVASSGRNTNTMFEIPSKPVVFLGRCSTSRSVTSLKMGSFIEVIGREKKLSTFLQTSPGDSERNRHWKHTSKYSVFFSERLKGCPKGLASASFLSVLIKNRLLPVNFNFNYLSYREFSAACSEDPHIMV